ncbi:MAG: TetR/AcrR family transcriptional regulator [Pseudomonadales bacterium]|nr:TetR/AcrR family transcriptional regulator [Pseudomonadales bacterium]
MDLMTENRLARRAAILRTAREMIAERGYEAITIRELAEACRVSVPTLYNQFGGKDKLLAAAIEDHFGGGGQDVSIFTELSGFDRIFAMLEFIAQRFLADPGFHRRLLEAFSSLESTQDVQTSITESLLHEIAGELEVTALQGDLANWVDVELLSGQVTTAFVSATVIWGSGQVADEQLLASIEYGTGLVLLAAASDRSVGPIQKRVEQAQKTLRHHPAKNKQHKTQLKQTKA